MAAHGLPEDFAPPLDDKARTRLRALARGELPEPSADVLRRLMLAFPSWARAYAEALDDPSVRAPARRMQAHIRGNHGPYHSVAAFPSSQRTGAPQPRPPQHPGTDAPGATHLEARIAGNHGTLPPRSQRPEDTDGGAPADPPAE